MIRKSLGSLAILVVLLGVGFYFFRSSTRTESPGNDTWKTSTDTKQGISFQYPENLSTKYISALKWPPMVKVEQRSAYPCPADSRQIDGKFSYCVQTKTEDVYTAYTYSTGSLRENQAITIGFSLHFAQCGDYNDPQKTECEQERQNFALDALVDRIAHSIVFQK